MDRQFYSEDVIKLLRHKFVIVIGDSIHRSIYKDIVLLVQKDRYLTRAELKSKGELSFLDDKLIEGGQKEGLSNGIKYKEMRQYKTEKHHIRFYFVTRCYNTYVKSIILDLQDEPPDIVVMNSCLWDISRYGKNSLLDFKSNILSLFCDLNTVLPRDCMMIWNTTLPISKYARGGFLPPEEEFQHSVMCADIREANLYTKHAAHAFNINILDLYFHLRDHGELQVQDGIHWDMIAHRFITNLIMEIVCDYFGSHVPWRPPQVCVHHRPPNLIGERSPPLNRPSQNLFLDDTPLRPLQAPVRRRRAAHCRHQILNSSQNSSGLQSPFSEHSFSDLQSPFAHYSPNSSFQSPHFFQSPINLNNLVASQVNFPPSTGEPSPYFFNSDGPMSFSNPNYFQNSNVRDSPYYLDFENPRVNPMKNNFLNPNVSESLRQLTDVAANVFNGVRCPNPCPRPYQNQSYPQPLREVSNGFFNLGQYAEQRGQSGAMRRPGRRRHQPYQGDKRK